MNAFLSLLGIESWKPILGALALPPVPFLLMILVGARLMLPRRGLGWFVILLGLAGLWVSSCAGFGQVLNQWVLKQPPAFSTEAIAQLKAEVKAKQPVAIVVLGSGTERLAPEYGVSNLKFGSLERLRYGLWLSRETGAPVAFSGGVGWAQKEGQAEAQVAAHVASHDFGRPLRWTEDQSRDTRENAIRTVSMLKNDGIKRIILVTHGSHMPRALRAFESMAQGSIKIDVAPMGLAARIDSPVLDWFPSADGAMRVNQALHELLGLMVGA
ncbi:MAG: hypothetical protein RLZZ618_4132 [Pseudomonadota bacterium]|jgi:uncharacterized SAM-binding protein YcdF (DUF218 family)